MKFIFSLGCILAMAFFALTEQPARTMATLALLAAVWVA